MYSKELCPLPDLANAHLISVSFAGNRGQDKRYRGETSETIWRRWHQHVQNTVDKVLEVGNVTSSPKHEDGSH